jgi:hypothetical protein
MKDWGPNLPIEVRNRLPDAFRAVIARYTPDTDPKVVVAHLRAARDEALVPWERQQAVERMVFEAAGRLPFEMKCDREWSKWRLKALQSARNAAANLKGDASLDEVRLATRVAVAYVEKEFRHAEMCRRRAENIFVLGATMKDREDGQDLVRLALARLPVGASERQVGQAAEEALQPIRDRILHRKAESDRGFAIRMIDVPLSLAPAQREAAAEAIRTAVAGTPDESDWIAFKKAGEKALQTFLGPRTGGSNT